MSRLGWQERVALTVYDEMAHAGADPVAAALIGRAVLAELRQDPDLPELHLVRIGDSFGQTHDIVVRHLPSGDAKPLFEFDLRVMGRVARQAVAREFEADADEGDGEAEV